MSILFTPYKIGKTEIKNRFVKSATYESMSRPDGIVTEQLITTYRLLAKGDVGLIIPGFMNVHPYGKAMPFQTGIYSDDMIPGLRRLTDAVHEYGAKIFFQLAHAGMQTSREVLGRTPMGPSGSRRDPVYLFKPAKMSQDDIVTAIRAFSDAAQRAAEAGADGVQIHAAHGYLISQFLSPFLNDRDDAWGGSDENRFRLMREVMLAVRTALPPDMPVIVKINVNDFAPKDGVQPELAKKYCGWLAALKVDGIETSCSLPVYSFMNMIRGDVPVRELVRAFPLWKRPAAWVMTKRLDGNYNLEEGYNLDGAKVIRSATGSIPLIVVGGMRSKGFMEKHLLNGDLDFISMARPFIREPDLVKRFRAGKSEAASCVSCNQCFAAMMNRLPLRCYNKDLYRHHNKKSILRANV